MLRIPCVAGWVQRGWHILEGWVPDLCLFSGIRCGEADPAVFCQFICRDRYGGKNQEMPYWTYYQDHYLLCLSLQSELLVTENHLSFTLDRGQGHRSTVSVLSLFDLPPVMRFHSLKKESFHSSKIILYFCLT